MFKPQKEPIHSSPRHCMKIRKQMRGAKVLHMKKAGCGLV